MEFVNIQPWQTIQTGLDGVSNNLHVLQQRTKDDIMYDDPITFINVKDLSYDKYGVRWNNKPPIINQRNGEMIPTFDYNYIIGIIYYIITNKTIIGYYDNIVNYRYNNKLYTIKTPMYGDKNTGCRFNRNLILKAKMLVEGNRRYIVI